MLQCKINMTDSIYTTGEYASKNQSYHTEDSAWKAKQIFKMIQSNHLQPLSVCEVGCGAGEILRQLQISLPNNIQFAGYEISPQAYALCEERTNPNLSFYCADLLTVDSVQFDIILCIDVFEHVENYIDFIRKLRAKGKLVIFHIPLDLSVQMIVRSHRLLFLRNQVGHLHYFSKDTALATLQDAGYKVIDWFYTPSIIELQRNSAIGSRLLYWPRRFLFWWRPDLTVRMLGGYSLLVLAS